MTQLGELLRHLCPDGVAFLPLGELLAYEQPGKYLVASTAYEDSFATPVLTAGQSFVLGHTDEVDGIYPASPGQPVVIFDDFTTASKWVDFPFKAKSSAMKILALRDPDPVSLKFAFHAMQVIKYQPQDHARQWISTYAHFRIPWPPRDVRREIVRVLDVLGPLGGKLNEELQAELAARRKQYGYYRDQLLAFSHAADVEWVPMGKVGAFLRGRRFTKDDVVQNGIPSIHYGEIYTTYGTATSTTVSQVRRELTDRLRFAQPNDVVIATVGETVEDVAKAVAWLGDGPVAIHDDTVAFRSEMNPRFVAHAMQTTAFHAQKNRHVARAKVKRIRAGGLAKILIPVPKSIDEQERVASVLDALDVRVTDLTVELTAEMPARREQYEHFRNKLLSFQEAVG